MPEIRMGYAINRALSDAMSNDASIVLMGQDIAEFGGSFGVTKGLLAQFGPTRVRDMPIAESVLASAAVGAAMSGLKPVIEIMFMDFITLAMDAIVNQAAKAHFMFGGQCAIPLVLRTPHGGGISAGPQHSQCLEAWFAHIPGLKVVCPATVSDAYGLLRAAIDDPNPVLFIEHKALYGMKGELTHPTPPVPIGTARNARAGRDVSIVTYGRSVHEALRAAEILSREGIELDVIDLRSLQPWDEECVLASLAHTHRLVIFHEATQAFGVGAEIAARMADIGFDELDAPILRLGAPFVPSPSSKGLEEHHLPGATTLVETVRRVLE